LSITDGNLIPKIHFSDLLPADYGFVKDGRMFVRPLRISA